MQEPMQSLVRIQGLDSEIKHIEDLEAISASRIAKEERAVAEARALLEQTEEQVKQLQMVVDKHNMELTAIESEVQKLEGQKMTLKTNEEYTTMQKQIDAKMAEVGALEEKILEAMEVVDVGKQELPPRLEEMKQREQALEQARKRVESEKKDLRNQVAQLRKQWEELAAGSGREIIERYVTIRDRRQGRGVAILSPDNKCQECFMTTSPQVMISVLKGDLTECPSCGRLLYSDAIES